MGLGVGGLPLGMSIITDHLQDTLALDIAERFQRRTEFHRLRPPAVLS
jgi:Asp-tRNA(Asn)/Glu-tRNA(Gln) amidotransferase A subunit family amidase